MVKGKLLYLFIGTVPNQCNQMYHLISLYLLREQIPELSAGELAELTEKPLSVGTPTSSCSWPSTHDRLAACGETPPYTPPTSQYLQEISYYSMAGETNIHMYTEGSEIAGYY